MAMPLKPGLTPAEVAFLCEMEQVTVIPRQRLASLDLIGGRVPDLKPPFPVSLPLWYALLLRRQKRCNIQSPPWLRVEALQSILDFELEHAGEAFSPGPRLEEPMSISPPSIAVTVPSDPIASYGREIYLDASHFETSSPFHPNSATSKAQSNALPYHWMEMAHLLLSHAEDDIQDADTIRSLVRDLREVRMAKLRKGVSVLSSGAGTQMNGVGAMEIAESRGMISEVVDGLRKINASREQARRERDEDERRGGLVDNDYDYEEDNL